MKTLSNKEREKPTAINQAKLNISRVFANIMKPLTLEYIYVVMGDRSCSAR
jgi:hypothetical protein